MSNASQMRCLLGKNSSTDDEQKAPCKVNINFIILPREAKRKTCFFGFKKLRERIAFWCWLSYAKSELWGEKFESQKSSLELLGLVPRRRKKFTQSPSERLNCNFLLLQFLLCIFNFFSTGKEFLRYFGFFT